MAGYLEELGYKTREISYVTLFFTINFFLSSLLRIIYAKLTNRKVYIGWILLIDTLLLGLNLAWSAQVDAYENFENPAFFVENPTLNMKVGAAIFYVDDDKEVKPIKVLLILLFWLRFVFMLQMTRMLGPLI